MTFPIIIMIKRTPERFVPGLITLYQLHFHHGFISWQVQRRNADR